MILTRDELVYLEACMIVADGDGEHAEEFKIDQGALQAKLQNAIARQSDGQSDYQQKT